MATMCQLAVPTRSLAFVKKQGGMEGSIHTATPSLSSCSSLKVSFFSLARETQEAPDSRPCFTVTAAAQSFRRRPSIGQLQDAAKAKEAAERKAPAGNQEASSLDLESRFSVAANTGSLDLSDCGLSDIPPAVWQIGNLTDLSLAGNAITELPENVGQLKQLKRLGLAGNLLQQLPEEIGQLELLEGLWLHGNVLGSLPPQVGDLRRLKMLALAGNQLAALPASLAALSSLQVLSVAGNRLQALPEDLGGLKALRVLALYGNSLQILPSSIWGLTSLQDLWLQGNRLQELPSGIESLRDLRQLSLADNLLRKLPPGIGLLPKLETLWLYGNQLKDFPVSLGSCKSLSHLWLESNPLEVCQLAEALPSLRHLRAVGIDTWQAANLPAESATAMGSRLLVGPVAGSGNARSSGGYLKVQQAQLAAGRDASSAKLVVVALGSAPGVPNWGGLLARVRQAMTGGKCPPDFDILYAVDSRRSWFTHGRRNPPTSPDGTYLAQPPLSATSTASSSGNEEAGKLTLVPLVLKGSGLEVINDQGAEAQEPANEVTADLAAGDWAEADEGSMGEYFKNEILAAICGYERVLLLGDSMGASAALLFSPLATGVLAFCPQVDLARAAIRPGRPLSWLAEYHRQLAAAVATSHADISIHCGNWSHDVDQARLVEAPKVDVIIHPVDDHRLAKVLDGAGRLLPIVRAKIEAELAACRSP